MQGLWDLFASSMRELNLHGSRFLLAFSGGCDSLALFLLLLEGKQRGEWEFEVLHIDHGWRVESATQASEMRRYVDQHDVVFHLRTLDPKQWKGNWEQSARLERYHLFRQICHERNLRGVLTAHHRDDQVETVLKRIFEGAYWPLWRGIASVQTWEGLSIFRPLLSFQKTELESILVLNQVVPWEDSTNEDVRFLRARFRKQLLPYVKENFGKNISSNLVRVSQEMGELADYMEARLALKLSDPLHGPWGTLWSLQEEVGDMIEAKILLRRICREMGVSFSWENLNTAASTLMKGALGTFYQGKYCLHVEGSSIFFLSQTDMDSVIPGELLELGAKRIGKWQVRIGNEEGVEPSAFWQEVWNGKAIQCIPTTQKWFFYNTPDAMGGRIRKRFYDRCRQHRIPVVLRSRWPSIVCENGDILLFGEARAFKKEPSRHAIIINYLS